MEYCGPPNGPLYKSGCYWKYKKECAKAAEDEDADKTLRNMRIIVSLEIVVIVALWLIIMASFV